MVSTLSAMQCNSKHFKPYEFAKEVFPTYSSSLKVVAFKNVLRVSPSVHRIPSLS